MGVVSLGPICSPEVTDLKYDPKSKTVELTTLGNMDTKEDPLALSLSSSFVGPKLNILLLAFLSSPPVLVICRGSSDTLNGSLFCGSVAGGGNDGGNRISIGSFISPC